MNRKSISIEQSRKLFPATEKQAYFNTAATSLGSTILGNALSDCVSDWTENGFDFVRGEEAGERSRSLFAKIIGANVDDIALIPSVSSAAGLIASQFEKAKSGENIIIGEREYSSNHFPWKLLGQKGYQIRQIPFRNGGLEPEDIKASMDGGTRLVAFSAVQTASGHRSDISSIAAIAKQNDAITFVDGSQMAGALPVAPYLDSIDVFSTPNHKFLLNAGRGMGYCYFHKNIQSKIIPTSAGWKAGAVPFDSFFGPDMHLSDTASRFDNSISWLAAIGDEASLSVFDLVGIDAIYNWNAALIRYLLDKLIATRWLPVESPQVNRSTIVGIPIGEKDPARLLQYSKKEGIACSIRDGNLRISVHFYNNYDDIDHLVSSLEKY